MQFVAAGKAQLESLTDRDIRHWAQKGIKVKILKAIAWSAVGIVSILFALRFMVDRPQDAQAKKPENLGTIGQQADAIDKAFGVDPFDASGKTDKNSYFQRLAQLHNVPRRQAMQIARIYFPPDLMDEFNKQEDDLEVTFAQVADEKPEAAKAMVRAEMNPVIACEEGGWAIRSECYNPVVQCPNGLWTRQAYCDGNYPAASTPAPNPSSAKHKPAPIIDGPAYIASQAEKELEKDQANSTVGPDTAGQPHDDGNGIPVDPGTAPKP
jgi:hypothetical protein